jgi:hypothetical protein
MRPEHARLLASARNVQRVEEWLWRSPAIPPVSYPDNGHAACAVLEDDSFWFEHRNRCIQHVLRTFPPGGVLLDIGGGNGIVTRHLEANGFPALLLEPGAAGVATARSRGLSPIIQSTLEEAGFAHETVPARSGGAAARAARDRARWPHIPDGSGVQVALVGRGRARRPSSTVLARRSLGAAHRGGLHSRIRHVPVRVPRSAAARCAHPPQPPGPSWFR